MSLKTITDFRGLKPADQGAVIALGNFDGIHRGHQAVMTKAKEIAEELSAPLGIGVFRPHPTRYFQPDAPPFRLMSSKIREKILPQYGVDFLYELSFDERLTIMDDAQFVEQIMHKGLGVKHVVVGKQFRFGYERCGDLESLTKICAAYGIGVTGLEEVGLHKFYGKYGSSDIRTALQEGDVFHAAHMLSRPWIVDGVVTKGEQRGRTIGFPTANVEFGHLIRPKFGVYSVQVKIEGDDTLYNGVANTGSRPTVGGTTERVEVNIFDFDQDIYGKEIEVHFRSFIREEKKFESFEALKEQIAKDALGARAVLGCL